MVVLIEQRAEKSKTMTDSTNHISADISMNGQKLEEVTSFKYLGAILCKDGTCLAEGCIRIASAMAAMARLNRILQRNTISLASKFKLYKSFVTFTLLHCCETWTLLADCEERIQALETKFLKELLRISNLEHKTDNCLRSKINFPVGPQEPLLAIVKKC